MPVKLKLAIPALAGMVGLPIRPPGPLASATVTWPLNEVATLLYGSSAVTFTAKEMPAVTPPGGRLTMISLLAAAGFTAMPVCAPVTAEFAVSVTVIVCGAAVLSVAVKVWTPLSPPVLRPLPVVNV